MSKATERLIRELSAHEDALWRLHNDALALAMESPDSRTVQAVVAGLGEIAEIAGAARARRLAQEARRLADSLAAGAGTAEHQRAFDLVEAIATVAGGEGPEDLLRLLDAPAEDRPEPEQPIEERPEEEQAEERPEEEQEEEPGAPLPSVLRDDYSAIDAEESHFFCAEAREHLGASEGLLVELERTGSSDDVDEIFRGFHSIKGGAQYLGLEATATVAHRLETVLDKLRRGEIEARGKVVTLLLRGVDYLVKLIDGVESGKQPEIDPEVLLRALDACIAGETIDDEALTTPQAAPQATPEVASAKPSEPGDSPAPRPEPAAGTEAEELEDRELFAVEYREHHDSARQLLSDLDSLINDQQAVVLASRNLHSLKGIAGFAGLVQMELLAAGIDLLVRGLGNHGGKAPHDARRAVDAAFELLEVVVDDFLAGRETTVDASEEVARLKELAEREARVSEWSASELEEILESADPLRRFLGQLISAHGAGEEDSAVDAACRLEESAGLHGYEGLAEAAAALAGDFPGLSADDRIRRLKELQGMMPAAMEETTFEAEAEAELSFEDLALSIPGIGPKKLEALISHGVTDRESALEAGLDGISAVRGIGMDQAQAMLALCAPSRRIQPAEPETVTRDFAALELKISADDYDRELVDIYLETNRRRLVEAEEALGADEATTALELLEDSAAAAGYMGYTFYSEALREAHDALAGEPPEPDRALEQVLSVAASMDRLMDALPAATGEETETVAREEVELEHIFAEAAAGHLEEVTRDLPLFLTAMDEALLASLQHHLTCLEAASTNLDKAEVADKAQRTRSRIEDLWLDSTSLDQERSDRLIEDLGRLYLLCDLSPPELPVVEPGALAPAEADTLEADTLEADTLEADTVRPHIVDSESVEDLDELDLALAGLGAGEPPAPSTAVAPPTAGDGREMVPQTLVSPAGDEPAAADDGAPPPAGGGDALPPGPREPGSTEPPGPPPEGPGDVQRGLVEAQATVRVDTEKIDDLMNMAAELVVNRSAFMALGTELSDVIFALSESGNINKVEARNLRLVANRYDEVTTDLGRVSNQLQEGVMRIRMMPVKTLFARIPRLVRGLALSEGKQVDVTFEGEETELDKSVIEKLSDPLVHLIRNSVDHGIEDPAARLASGKPAAGRLKITSSHEGNMVILGVEDDGSGIDPEMIRQRLVEMQVSGAAEARRLSERDLLAAVFLPGFSTASSVGDTSGRGVGLDVVKRNIEGLGGQVEVSSEPGRFCRFSIRIPLTMAIMQALLVKVGDEVFSIPVAAVIQTVRASAGEVSTVDGQEVITIRDQVVSLVRIDDVCSYEYHLETDQMDPSSAGGRNGPVEEGEAADELYVVVLQGESQELGIVVDDLLGSQDIVIKGLDDELVDAEGIAGASILGDGTVTLILDVAEIQRMTVDRERHEQKKLHRTFRQFEQFLRLDGRHEASGPN